jgi:hypothetical protein
VTPMPPRTDLRETRARSMLSVITVPPGGQSPTNHSDVPNPESQ